MSPFKCILFLVLLQLSKCEVLNLACRQIRALVDAHNTHRQQVAQGSVEGQPAASNMKFMIWDTELADKAAEWAANGDFQHNPDRTIPSGRFSTGENIYTFMTTSLDYEFDAVTGVNDWFEEYKDFTFDLLTEEDFQRPSDSEIGHYTQMVWANSIYFGCAVDNRIKNGWNTFLLVCNYGPAGNMIGEEPYQTGYNGSGLHCGTDDCSNLYGDKC